MRSRFNRNAVCSSQNYSASKKAHKELLQEKHNSFSLMTVSSSEEEITLGKKFLAKSYMVTIWVFGKPIQVSREDYNRYCYGFTKH